MYPDRRLFRFAGLTGAFFLWAAAATAQNGLIFADGFESGNMGAWSRVSGGGGGPGCIEGLRVADDLGPAPGAPFEEITCVEIRNDQPFERAGEAAYSGIPLPRDLDLTSTDDLVLIGPGLRRLAAQFDVLSRWGGPPDDTARPIRWLEASVVPRIAANSRAVYSLRRYTTPPPVADPMAATATPSGARYEVSTGLADFTLDPQNPAFFHSIAIDPGDGSRSTVYTHTPGAGPRLAFDPGTGEVILDSTDPARVTVAPGSFAVLENGPVKVVARLRGHFSAPGGTSLCTAVDPPYERFGYTVIATFTRGSRDVHLEFHFRNECSDAFTIDWFDDAVTVSSVSWELPLDAGLAGPPTAYHAGGGSVAASAAGFSGLTLVEQRKGAGAPWQRRARVTRDATNLETAEFFDSPFVALTGGSFVAAAQMPWMRYREPQALAIAGKTLSLRFVSEALVVGEAKGLWNLAKLSFAPVPSAGGLASVLESLRDRGHAELERGLLVRAPLEHLNASGLFASLGTDAPSPIKTYYLDTLEAIHAWTVDPGGQWDRAKTFGSQLWPDVQFDQWSIDFSDPAQNAVASNYWNPSGAELLEFLRAGDPKWVWDFALPQSWRQAMSAYLNLGEHSHGNRNGFTVAGTGSGEGHWNRDGFNSSDDYNYNLGMQLAYALRPNGALRDRFAQAGRTVVERYDVAKADEASRDAFVNAVEPVRGAIQHFEHLANCAEFVPGARGAVCQAKLLEIGTELAQDNLSSGVLCGGDLPAGNPCSTPQQFMTNAHIYHFFHRLYANYGDLGGLLRRALVETPRAYYTWGTPKQADGISIALGPPDWPGGLDCTLTAARDAVVSCAGWTGADPTFWENRPHTVSLILMAHELDPSIGLCEISKQALDGLVTADAFVGFMSNDAGWWKGAAQMMQGMVFGVGGYDWCSD